MANENSIPSASRPTFGPHGIYTLTEGTHSTAAYDHLSNRLTQLRAMLDTVWGQGYENFKCCNEDIQSGFLWNCAEMARECEQLIGALGPAVYEKADTL